LARTTQYSLSGLQKEFIDMRTKRHFRQLEADLDRMMVKKAKRIVMMM
jgi:hypothetical protein